MERKNDFVSGRIAKPSTEQSIDRVRNLEEECAKTALRFEVFFQRQTNAPSTWVQATSLALIGLQFSKSCAAPAPRAVRCSLHTAVWRWLRCDLPIAQQKCEFGGQAGAVIGEAGRNGLKGASRRGERHDPTIALLAGTASVRLKLSLCGSGSCVYPSM